MLISIRKTTLSIFLFVLFLFEVFSYRSVETNFNDANTACWKKVAFTKRQLACWTVKGTAKSERTHTGFWSKKGFGLTINQKQERLAQLSQHLSNDPSSNADIRDDIALRLERSPAWVPKWAVMLSPVQQVLIVLVVYALHLGVLCRTAIPFPVELVPNNDGLFQSLGLDSVAGIISLCVLLLAKGRNGHRPMKPRHGPWRVAKKNKIKVVVTTFVLAGAYVSSGYGNVIWENLLFILACVGAPITIPMHRSLQVLLSHLTWVFLGIGILGNVFKPFFKKTTRWMKVKWNCLWVWWVLGGYFISSLLFNICDVANQFVLPPSVFEAETVVLKMINPENNDALAMAVGALAPCVSAPWWEEVLYRGFILPGLSLFFPQANAISLSALLFAAHHMNLAGMIPLTALGFLWAILYVQSQNLLVTMIIHALWNSRVFLGSYLGV